MKRALALLLAAGCASGAPAAAPPAAPAPAAAKVPDAEVRTLEGKPVLLSSLRAEKPVLLLFTSSWCSTCRKEIPLVNEYAKTHAVVAVFTADQREDVEYLRRETGFTYPAYLDDGRAARAFGIKMSPTFIEVEGDGTILYRGDKPPGKSP